jgi:hypothetical protein
MSIEDNLKILLLVILGFAVAPCLAAYAISKAINQ